MKSAALTTPLLPHQQRVIDKLKASGGVLVAHGVGSGKCVRGDTPVLTSQGLRRIDALFPDDLEPGEAERTYAGDGLQVCSLVDGALRWMPVRARYTQRLSDTEFTVDLETLRGHRLKVTQRHPLPVIREGALTWVPAGQLQVGDWLAMPNALPPSPKTVKLRSGIAELLGWQVGEGYENAASYTTTITQHNLSVLQHLQGLFQALYPESTSGHIKGKETELHIACKAYRLELEKLSYVWGLKSKDKRLPPQFIHWPLEELRKVIRALFDGEGHVGPRNIELTSKSEWLVRQLEYGLLRFGIRSATHKKYGRATNSQYMQKKELYWRLSISGEDCDRFFQERLVGYEYKKAAQIKRPRNANYGVPIQWFSRGLKTCGLTPKAIGFATHDYESCDPKTATLLALRLREALFGLRKLKNLGGTAGRFQAAREHALIANRAPLTRLLERLETLLSLPLRFEPITRCDPGEQGGLVYDLSVDADNYENQNYVAGEGGFLIHNTLTSLGAADQLGTPADVIVPAPLVSNYDKEIDKHHDVRPTGIRVRSYERARNDRDVRTNGLVVLDEAQRVRNLGTGISKEVAEPASRAKARLLLTGTPTYNNPSDLGVLLNFAAGKDVVPNSREAFKARYIGKETIQPGLLNRLLGDKPTERAKLINRDELVNAATGYVDVHRSGGADFPSRTDEDVDVEMSPKQWETYRFLEGKMPWLLRRKVQAGLPLSKAESKSLNSFEAGLRQVSNTPRPYDHRVAIEQELEHSPKLRRVVEDLVKARKANPEHRGIIYSNYLEGGLDPISRELTAQKVPHSVFHGGVPKALKAQMVRDYNSGKVPNLLISASGAEGLDLKGTRSIQEVEPHWNEGRTGQVEGRGIRYKSHEHLPQDQRNVRVLKYYSKPPSSLLGKLFGEKNLGIERYIAQSAREKGRLGEELMAAMQEASDRGPLKKESQMGIKVAVSYKAIEDVVSRSHASPQRLEQFAARMKDRANRAERWALRHERNHGRAMAYALQNAGPNDMASLQQEGRSLWAHLEPRWRAADAASGKYRVAARAAKDTRAAQPFSEVTSQHLNALREHKRLKGRVDELKNFVRNNPAPTPVVHNPVRPPTNETNAPSPLGEKARMALSGAIGAGAGVLGTAAWARADERAKEKPGA